MSSSSPLRPKEGVTGHHNTLEVISCAQKPFECIPDLRIRSRVLLKHSNVQTIDQPGCLLRMECLLPECCRHETHDCRCSTDYSPPELLLDIFSHLTHLCRCGKHNHRLDSRPSMLLRGVCRLFGDLLPRQHTKSSSNL